MGFFSRKRKSETEELKAEFDRETQKPVLRCSICNGEQVAGFKDIRTGKFEEVMFVRNDRDLEEFKKRYGIEEVAREY